MALSILLTFFLSSRFAGAESGFMNPDPCLNQCVLESGINGITRVLCNCREQPGKPPAGPGRKKNPFPSPVPSGSIRGTTEEEREIVESNWCESESQSPFCKCVNRQRIRRLKKTCEKTGAGEKICQFEPDGPALRSPRPSSLFDYQACLANRITYSRSACDKRACSKFREAYDGGGNVRDWNIKISPDFSESEKATIEIAIRAIPACWKKYFEGLEFKKKRLFWINQRGGSSRGGFFACEAGKAKLWEKKVDLDPYCGITVGIVAHELFHVLGERSALRKRWEGENFTEGKCPVTKYGALSPYEDFAEAGRLLLFPQNDGWSESMEDGDCVQNKIENLGRVLVKCEDWNGRLSP